MRNSPSLSGLGTGSGPRGDTGEVIPVQRTDNSDRQLQLCLDNRLFLGNTSFRHKERYCLTWRPSESNQRWTQVDHIVISHRWRGSTEDCRSFWSTCLDSVDALIRERICLCLTGT
ncbi:unnamed protein product [Schistosoma rodhaini]|uniref:Uncharacterized protein n=1 Tax=Schistosoma rodhaini TaxID=6188 RepID=A0AA85G1K9_9TREM|nr:unnamed protein product [Schistosoma rodhaini]